MSTAEAEVNPAKSRRPSAAQRWTVEAVRGLGAVTDLPTAAAVIGIGRNTAYELAAKNELPFKVLRCGNRWRVPVAGLLAALGCPVGSEGRN